MWWCCEGLGFGAWQSWASQLSHLAGQFQIPVGKNDSNKDDEEEEVDAATAQLFRLSRRIQETAGVKHLYMTWPLHFSLIPLLPSPFRRVHEIARGMILVA